MKNATFLAPKLVAQISFTEWTRDSKLRQPAFLGLREDKSPQEVQLREN
jgi:bifunctional non-homologous end joining protein LigD